MNSLGALDGAVLAAEQGDRDRASLLLEQSFSSRDLTEPKIFASLSAFAKQQWDDLVLRTAEHIVETNCESSRNLKIIARSAYNLEKYSYALSVLSKFPQDVGSADYGAASLLARCLSAIGDNEAAEHTYEAIAKGFPTRYEPLWELANLCYRNGNLLRAYDTIALCKDRAPENHNVLRRFANLSILQGRPMEAAKALFQVASATGDVADWVNYVRASFVAGNTAEVARVWSQTIDAGRAFYQGSDIPHTLTPSKEINSGVHDQNLSVPKAGYVGGQWPSDQERLSAVGGLTVILTSYRRPEYLPFQLYAIENQTVRPDYIWHWSNNGGDDVSPAKISGLPTAFCSANFKYHGRFAMGLLARTKYIAIFDDDTVPGPLWLENCLRQMADRPAIFGTIGVTSDVVGEYVPNTRCGWAGENNISSKVVDLVGHSWVFERSVLKHFWEEEPLSWVTGEDIHLSFAAQVRGGVATVVPPHHPDNKASWGSLLGTHLGADHEAASFKLKGDHNALRSACMQEAVARGWVQQSASMPFLHEKFSQNTTGKASAHARPHTWLSAAKSLIKR